MAKTLIQPIGHFRNLYNTLIEAMVTSSRVEHGGQGRGYNLPKALGIPGKNHKVIEYDGHCWVTIRHNIWWTAKNLM